MARRPASKKLNPRRKAGKTSTKLSPAKEAAAKRSKKPGRHYPSLVDNMRAVGKKKTARKKKAKTKKAGKRKARKG